MVHYYYSRIRWLIRRNKRIYKKKYLVYILIQEQMKEFHIEEKAILITFLTKILEKKRECKTTLLERKTFINIIEKLQG